MPPRADGESPLPVDRQAPAGWGAPSEGHDGEQASLAPRGAGADDSVLPAPLPNAPRVATDTLPGAAARGRRGAAGCAIGSVVIAVLSKIAIAGKILLPVLSAVVSFGAYAWLFGWQFGVGLLALLFLHEMGHFVVIRAKGLPASLPIFIPLVGAYVAMEHRPFIQRPARGNALHALLASAPHTSRTTVSRSTGG